MKTLSANSEAAIDRQSVEPIRLLTIAVDGLSLYYCDRVFGVAGSVCEFDGKLFEPLICEFGDIKSGLIDPVSFESDPASAHFVIMNDCPTGGADRFSELFASYSMQAATVTIDEIYSPDATAADKVALFKGTIEDITGLTRGRATVTCGGFELDIVNRFQHSIVDDSNYPGADPDDVGKMIPQIYGEAKRVPAIAVDAGGKTTIAEEMTATTPAAGGTLQVSDGSAFPTAGFVIQIDSEQIYIATRSGNTLSLALPTARGWNSTEAVAHDMGAPIAEIQTEYVYLLADHPVDEISEVYVDGIRQTSVNKYTGKTGEEKTGYAGKAVAVFDALPIYAKQVNVEVDDTIDVSDTIGVDTGSHNHGGTEQVVVWRFEQAQNIVSNVYNPMSCVDGNHSTLTTLDNKNAKVRVSKAYYESYDGNPSQFRICVSTGTVGSGSNIDVTFLGRSVNFYSSNQVQKSSWYSTSYSWASINSQTADCEVQGNNNPCYLAEVWAEFKYTPAANSSAADGVAKTGNASKTGTVTISGNSTAETVVGQVISADISGFVDDASGTYTGTSGALIKRATDIFKHVLADRCGLTLADAIDAASYADARSYLVGRAWSLGFAILERPSVRELLNALSFQSRLFESWDAGKHFVCAVNADLSLAKNVDSSRIDQGQIWLSYTDRVDIVNKLAATYDRQWSGKASDIESEQAVVKYQWQGSIDEYGERQAKPFSFFAVGGATQAQAVLNAIQGDRKFPRLMVEFAGGHYLTDLMVGDIIAFKVGEDAAMQSAGLGLIASEGHAFRIIEKTFRSDKSIQVKGVFAGIVPLTLTVNDLNVATSIDECNAYSMDMRVDISIDGDLTLTQYHSLTIDDLTVNTRIDSISFGGDSFILTEAGDFLLLENGDQLILAKAEDIKTENGDKLLTESGDTLLTEI